MMSVSEAVASRRTIRAFLDRAVPLDLLRRVLDKARMAPSGCNYQPWEATVLTGEPLRELQARIADAPMQVPVEYDVTPGGLEERYHARLVDNGKRMYAAEGIAREDRAGRDRATTRNLVSFGAPVLLLCHFPRYMGPPQWSDVGMWLQTIMLLLREEGLDSCPQEYLSYFAGIIKRHIGVDDKSQLLFCGLAIGWRDARAGVNNYERGRIALDEQVRFFGF